MAETETQTETRAAPESPEEGDRAPAIELRVHGVNGTAPSVLLDDPYPEQVAGDSDAHFYRRRDDDRATSGTTREAFWWSKLTSGSPTRAFWLLFLPFALVNLARFTLLTWDDARDGEAPAGRPRPLDRAADILLRLIGAVMTIGLLTTTFVVSADLLVRQCVLTPECRDDQAWLSWLGSWDVGPLLVLAVLPAVGVLGLFESVGRRTYVHSPPDQPPTWVADRRFGNQRFWREAAEVAVSRRLHLAACAAMLGLLTSGYGALTPASVVGVGVGVLAITVGLIAVAGIPRARPVSIGVMAVALVYAVVAVGLTAGSRWTDDSTVSPWTGMPPIVETGTSLVGAAVAALLALLTLVVLAQARTFRRAEGARRRPRVFRPLWGGLAPVVVASLAASLLGGYTTGIVFAVADVLGTVRPERSAASAEQLLTVGAGYWISAVLTCCFAVVLAVVAAPLTAWVLGRALTAVAWSVASLAAATAVVVLHRGERALGDALVLVAVIAALAGCWAWLRAGRRPAPPARRPDEDYPGRPMRSPRDLAPSTDDALDAVWRAWLVGRAKYRYEHVAGLLSTLAAVTVTFGGVLAVGSFVGVPVSPDGAPPFGPANDAAAIGAALAGAALLLLASLGVTTFRNQKIRTSVGILWDLISFWPRLVHPLCPPPYGGRAVIETATRAVDLTPGPDKPSRVVVLSGHSQGSLICVAAATLLGARANCWEQRASQPSLPSEPLGTAAEAAEAAEAARTTMANLALLTYGSQLQWAFPRLFPCFVGYHHLRRLYRDGLGGRWRSLHRETDPLGGHVLSWVEAGRVESFEVRGQVFDPATDLVSAEQYGPDVRLRDPVHLERSPWRSQPGCHGHSDYDADPAYAVVLGELIKETIAARSQALSDVRAPSP